jgi:exopolysaccharide biosynthesis polyprenyl glycosylphosphotransferase
MARPPRKDLVVPLVTVLSDIVAIEATFLFSYWLRFYSPLTSLIPVTLGIPELIAYVEGSLVVIPAWLLLFKMRGMYQPRRNVYFSDEFFAIVRVVFIGMLLVMAAAFFYREFSYSRLVFGMIGVFGILFISIGRFGTMKFEQWWYARGRDTKHVVIVGINETALRVYENIADHPSLGYQVIGYFSPASGKGLMAKTKLPCLGRTSGVPQYVKSHRVDVILVALTYKEHPQLYELVRDCEGLNTEIMMVPDMVELMTSRVRIRDLEGIPFIRIKDVPLSAWNQVVKRAFDIVFSSCVLILTSPLFLLIPFLIKLDSKGAAFFSQERVGLDGTAFRVLKFRTMRTDAEKVTGPVWAKKDDPRVTGTGRFLRRFSLDELPQLLNVLRGDMSIVGPRPERPHFVKQFRKAVPKYLDRHRVKTGMTGWAQVNGLRGNASIEERTKYDIYYVENWSLIFDLKIIFKTVRTVLFGKDAY